MAHYPSFTYEYVGTLTYRQFFGFYGKIFEHKKLDVIIQAKAIMLGVGLLFRESSTPKEEMFDDKSHPGYEPASSAGKLDGASDTAALQMKARGLPVQYLPSSEFDSMNLPEAP